MSPLRAQPTPRLCRASHGFQHRHLPRLSRRPQRRIKGIVGTRRCKLLQRRTYPATEAAVDFGTAARTVGHPPLVYWSVSPLRDPVPQVRNTAGALGLPGVRVDGRFGARRWFAAVALNSQQRENARSTPHLKQQATKPPANTQNAL